MEKAITIRPYQENIQACQTRLSLTGCQRLAMKTTDPAPLRRQLAAVACRALCVWRITDKERESFQVTSIGLILPSALHRFQRSDLHAYSV